jgi:DNA recombination protein RmuC
MEVVGIGVAALAVAIVVAAALLRRPGGPSGEAGPQLAVVNEKLAALEQAQREAGRHLQRLETRLAEAATDTSTIKQAAESIRGELATAREGLAELKSAAEARRDQERLMAESLRRLEAVIAGTSTKGAAGENIIDLVFAQLPPEWQERDFRLGNYTVEFALRAPNGLVLPIDSKWTATELLDRLTATDDPAEQQRLKKAIAEAALSRANEVRKYLHPELTMPFGVAVVPDAVYDLCGGVQARAFDMKVVLVSYSMFVPYLLLVIETVLKASSTLDIERLRAYLESADRTLAALQGEVEGRMSRAITTLGNSRDDMRRQLAHVQSGLRSLQERTGGLLEPPAELSAVASENGADIEPE